jgi:hypothetical protein
MEYLTNIPSILLLTFSIIALPSSTAKKTLAIGCDTYYRITGQIAGCTEASTENARELWIQRYSVCLQQQLSREISVYKGKLEIYYAQWEEKDSNQNIKLDDISLQNSNTSSFSLSETKSTTYRGNADFCK